MANRDMEGYILLNRNILDWRWARTPTTAYLFILMILKANFKDMPFENTVIKRGQFVTSVQSLCKLSGFKTQQVRTAISHLKKTNEITIETNNRHSVITIVNYDEYQNPTSTLTSELTNKQQTANKLLTTSNKVNKGNKGKKSIPPKSPKGDLTPSGGDEPGREEGTVKDIPEKHRDGTYHAFKTYAEYWDWRNQ